MTEPKRSKERNARKKSVKEKSTKGKEINGKDDKDFSRRLFSGVCTFLKGVSRQSDFPSLSLPEVAFAGRSNVGKSSLINALTNRRSLARVSNTPGRTQQVNFFNLSNGLILVDLPGYGYARAPKTQVILWRNLVNAYLAGRSSLRRTMLLIDSRHGVKQGDYSMMDMLDEAGQIYQVIMTKTDKIKPGALSRLTKSLKAELSRRPAAHPEIIGTSAAKKKGIEALRMELTGLSQFHLTP